MQPRPNNNFVVLFVAIALVVGLGLVFSDLFTPPPLEPAHLTPAEIELMVASLPEYDAPIQDLEEFVQAVDPLVVVQPEPAVSLVQDDPVPSLEEFEEILDEDPGQIQQAMLVAQNPEPVFESQDFEPTVPQDADPSDETDLNIAQQSREQSVPVAPQMIKVSEAVTPQEGQPVRVFNQYITEPMTSMPNTKAMPGSTGEAMRRNPYVDSVSEAQQNDNVPVLEPAIDAKTTSHTTSSPALEPQEDVENVGGNSNVPAILPATSKVKPKRLASKKVLTTWAEPSALQTQLNLLASDPKIRNWALDTMGVLEQLSDLESISDPNVERVWKALSLQQKDLEQLIPTLQSQATSPADVEQLKELRRFSYRISKRLSIWQAAYQLAGEETSVQVPARNVSAEKRVFSVHDSWRNYLMIDEANMVFDSYQVSEKTQQDISRRVLSRAFSPVLDQDQLKFIVNSFTPEELVFLREKATYAPNYAQVVADVEKYEVRDSGYASAKLNDHYQNLLWSPEDRNKELAYQIDSHYRNANVRVAVSEQLINRVLPKMPATNEPFSDNIQGAQIYGRNQISNRLGVELIPDPEQINLNLTTQGEVHSVTRALKGPFVVDNQGTARFQVFKRMSVGRNGFFSQSSTATSTAQQDIVGINTKMDSIPVVGWVARRLAQKKLRNEQHETDRLFRQKVESSATERVEVEVQKQLNQATAYIKEKILRPLMAMDLEPDPREMKTTEDEIVVRYRLAGRDQMAGDSARPRPVEGSLFNMQIHQSALNNILMRLDLNNQKFTMTELVTHLNENVGITVPAEAAQHKAELEFAPYDPVRLDFEDGFCVISLNLKSLRMGKGKRWKNLSVKSTYELRANGLNVELIQQDPGIGLKGRKLKLRDQIAIRTIFEAIFESTYNVNLIPDDMASRIQDSNPFISQLELVNGWMGVAIHDLSSVQQAEKPGDRSAFGGRAGRLLRMRR